MSRCTRNFNLGFTQPIVLNIERGLSGPGPLLLIVRDCLAEQCAASKIMFSQLIRIQRLVARALLMRVW